MVDHDDTPTAATALDERIAWFNDADAEDVRGQILALTAAPAWADELVAGRPYPDVEALIRHSEDILLNVDSDQIDAALAGHPRIGEQAQGLDAVSAARSAGEQAGMRSADTAQKQALAAANAAYEQKFGRIYLVAAAGLSAAELMAKAQARLHNDPVTELDAVRAELASITRLRLTGLLAGTGS